MSQRAYAPYRKVTASEVNNWRIQIDTLECGHQVFRRVVFHPEKATRRRCRKCLKLEAVRINPGWDGKATIYAKRPKAQGESDAR